MRITQTIMLMIFGGIVAIGMPVANAANTITADPTNVPLGGSTTITLCVDNDTDVNEIVIVDPTGTILEIKPVSVNIPAGGCADWTVPDAFDTVTLNQAGPWSFAVNTEQGIPLYVDFQVSFFVLPEAAIGAIAIVGSMVAVFGAYMFKKMN